MEKYHRLRYSLSCVQQTRLRRRVLCRRMRSSRPLDSFSECAMMELYFLTFIPMHHQGVLTLPLVKVKEKFQITLPVELREVLHLAVGDLLEATIQGQTIVLKPKDVVDRVHARQQLMDPQH